MVWVLHLSRHLHILVPFVLQRGAYAVNTSVLGIMALPTVTMHLICQEFQPSVGSMPYKMAIHDSPHCKTLRPYLNIYKTTHFKHYIKKQFKPFSQDGL